MKRALTHLALLIVAGYVTGFGSFLWWISEPTVVAGSATVARSAHQLLFGDDAAAPVTTGSIRERQAKPLAAKKRPEPNAIMRLWLATNYALSLCWPDDQCEGPDQRVAR